MGQQETAKQIWDYMTSNGWSKQAVAALLGNMQSESGIIADRWESDIVGNLYGGYGLVQWTPATKYIDWANASGLNYATVTSQCKRLDWEVANNEQFYCPFMTFQQFKVSQDTPENLAMIFIEYYERPANPNQPNRAEQARYWYNLFVDTEVAPRISVLEWFNKHRGHITYSMYGSRNGADGTADCSGSITQAVYESTGIPYEYLYSTITLGGYLSRCGYDLVLTGNSSGSNLNQIQDEDIILLSGGSSMADSGGAGGHTGVISGGGKNITSTCYYTQGEANTAIQELPLNADYLAGEFNYYEVWRPSGNPHYTNPNPNPSKPVSFSTNVHYSLHVLGGDWLSEVTNFNNVDSNGFAGMPFSKHDMLYIKVDKGDLRYRVHTIESGWLDYVNHGDPNDPVNGCAGNPGETIDGVEIYYTTPEGETLSQSYYRSQTMDRYGWLQTCCDDGTSIVGFDGWAGMMGEPLDRLQIGIATSNPFYNPSTGNITGNNNGGNISTNVHYSLRLQNGDWLDEVTNYDQYDPNGFAGLPNNKHDLLYIRVDKGELRYRVHTIESGWLDYVTHGDPNDPVNSCAGNPGETIDAIETYYTTPAGVSLAQSYYRSQTTARAGWLGVCCDDGTSIPGYDGWCGILGEPLDRFQMGVTTSNPFSTYIGGDDSGYYDGPEEPTPPSVNIDHELTTLARKAMKNVPIFGATNMPKIELKANQTYGPAVLPGADLWLTTSNTWTQEGSKGTGFSIKNGQVVTDIDDTLSAIHDGFVGTLEYYDFIKAVNDLSSSIDDGFIIFNIAARKEEGVVPGTKITFRKKIKKGDQTVEAEVSLEVYFKQVPGSPVTYPTSTYEQLTQIKYLAFGCVAITLAIFALPELIGAGVVAIGAALEAAAAAALRLIL